MFKKNLKDFFVLNAQVFETVLEDSYIIRFFLSIFILNFFIFYIKTIKKRLKNFVKNLERSFWLSGLILYNKFGKT